VVGKLLRVSVPGVRLERMMIIAIPLEVAEQLDEDLITIVDEPRLGEEETIAAEAPVTRERRRFYVGATIPREERPTGDDTPRGRVMVPLYSPTLSSSPRTSSTAYGPCVSLGIDCCVSSPSF
jgi:hypothetical protein